MKRLRNKIKEFLTNAWDEIEYGLRLLCGKPTPMKRFIAVLIIGGALMAANIYFVVSSIYNMGVHDVEKEFIELKIGDSQLQHIQSIELQKHNDSIKSIKNKEYE